MKTPEPFEPFGITRRHFFAKTARGLGVMALGGLLPRALAGVAQPQAVGGLPGFPNFAPAAKRVIYLFQSGAPSQMDLFDYKPLLNKLNGEQLPESVRGGLRLTGMTAQQSSIPLAGFLFKFSQHGQSGGWFSELLPQTASVADDLCVVRSMYTEAINHDPAITFFQTGSQIAGRPSFRVLGALRIGIDEPEPARVHRAGDAKQKRSAALFAALGQRLLGFALSRHPVPLGQGADSLYGQSGWAVRLGPARFA